MTITPITDLEVRGKWLLIRADLNVPMRNGRITDHTRIARFAQGMRPLLDQGARLVILTHLGRPDPASDAGAKAEFSVRQLVSELSVALEYPVQFCAETTGPKARAMARGLTDGQVLLCENLRFHAEEMDNADSFARDLARLGDIYVNDAFSCSHRAHASTEAVARHLPATAGPLLMQEIASLTSALESPAKPAVAIVGGSKVSTKISVLKNLVTRLDAVIIGGGMANTFLYAQGAAMGRSLHEPGQLETVAEIGILAQAAGCEILLPCDVVCARAFEAGTETTTRAAYACPDEAMILDAGPASVARFADYLRAAKTILWNGPLGAFELPPFDFATTALAREAAELARTGKATIIAGGGDTVAALNQAGVVDDFTYVSTAGGAFLEWLEGKTLPAIAALTGAAKAA